MTALEVRNLDDIVSISDDGETSCGRTSEMINPDVDFAKPTLIYHDSFGPLNLDILNQIDILLSQDKKLVLEIDIAGWFNHMFTLYQTIEGIYIVDSYIFQRTLEKRPIKLDMLYAMLIETSTYVGLYEKREVFDCVTKRKVIADGTSNEIFDRCGRAWYEFWGTRHLTGSRGNLDYYIINCYRING